MIICEICVWPADLLVWPADCLKQAKKKTARENLSPSPESLRG
ncbi:MAG: hypothetical protein GQF41_2479 [Candidatus Rifleibacterium amylolyticum]|nr:MAG: hypothetical protein GQF41_2479 [Candidatus Rifleibacterium amylolyticum]